MGAVRLRRHFYHCPACAAGFCPWDRVLALTAAALSPAAGAVICLAGVQASFAQASTRTLPKLAGLRVAESAVERATEAAGQRVGAALRAGQTFGPATPWAWPKDADGKTCACVGGDATGVGQQGPGGARAEGRMALIGVVYNPIPEQQDRWACPRGPRPAWQAHYLAREPGEISCKIARPGSVSASTRRRPPAVEKRGPRAGGPGPFFPCQTSASFCILGGSQKTLDHGKRLWSSAPGTRVAPAPGAGAAFQEEPGT